MCRRYTSSFMLPPRSHRDPDRARPRPRRLTAMRFGIDVAQQRMEWDELVARVRLGEELGFDGAWGFDHFQPMYGEGPGNCFEGMSTLAALSGVTSRIRLGLLVTGVTWFEPEHRALSFEFPSTKGRFDRLQDTLEIIKRLTTGEHVSYDGHQFR